PEAVAGLSELRAARQRSERRAERVVAPVAAPVPPAPTPERSTGAAGAPAAEPVIDGETLAARLARRRRGG
ncbi:MAG: signal recognition particle-docking protein FtsY, partial [Chloroflexota bacterium]|nr:signal recognition particle-docking protein FtsY [Chloroflexota bacterium]